jgi:glycosyltransferase involved in cell wall biosynthesis
MDNIKISVIIPTYNRKGSLAKCLECLRRQYYAQSKFEIIIVDDGSTDGTDILVREESKKEGPAIRYFRQEKKGPAAARNAGIDKARGEILLFLGDDILSGTNLLKEHAGWHELYPEGKIGILGHITWSRDIRVTPFMEWLESGGPQFAFHEIRDKVDVDADRFFYSSNISLKKNFLVSQGRPFDESFPWAAYEDLELGYRLKKRGAILKYNKAAIGYHDHPTSLKAACRRMTIVGRSRQIYAKKTGKKPEAIAKAPMWKTVLRKVKFAFYYLLAKYYETRAIKNNIFLYVMEYCANEGALRYK